MLPSPPVLELPTHPQGPHWQHCWGSQPSQRRAPALFMYLFISVGKAPFSRSFLAPGHRRVPFPLSPTSQAKPDPCKPRPSAEGWGRPKKGQKEEAEDVLAHPDPLVSRRISTPRTPLVFFSFKIFHLGTRWRGKRPGEAERIERRSPSPSGAPAARSAQQPSLQ